MTIKCIAIDDEPLALELIREYIVKFPALQLLQTFDDAISGGEFLRANPVDILFIDINMPDITGLDLVRSLQERPMIIFTTAHKKFALEGFELNVLDYLLKPITTERFLKAVNRAREAVLPENHFFIRTNNGYEKILHQEILFIEASQNYSFIYTPRGKLITHTALGTIEEQLPPAKFLRVHKSYIVSVDKIQAISGNEITIDKHKISFSKHYKDPLMKIIDSRLIRK